MSDADVLINDGLKSLTSGLGMPDHDKSATTSYQANPLNDLQLSNAYQGSWVAEKLVDIPAMDALRKWRNWQGEPDQVKKITDLEAKLGLQAKMQQCKIRARLWGGAAVFIGTTEEDYSEPLDPETIGLGDLQFLNVFSRKELSVSELVQDPTLDRYGLPERYLISGKTEQSEIHPSRLVVQIGKEHPDPFEATGPCYGWGRSVINAVYDAVRNADSVPGNIASLIFEANVNVFKIEDMMTNLGKEGYEEKLIKRFRLANVMKGINRALLLDKNEEYERKQVTFSALPDLLEKFMLIVCGAADIPYTRFFGQSPSGLSSTGEGDMKNYYDKVQSMQTLEIGPAMSILDECLIRSALGNRPEEITSEWVPLEQMSEKEIADIGKTTAETARGLADSGLFEDEELREVVTTQLSENGVFPRLAAKVQETGEAFGRIEDPEE